MKSALIAISVSLLLSACARDPQKAKAKYLADSRKYMKKGQYSNASVEFRKAVVGPPFRRRLLPSRSG
jgi:Tfp pilus assembly protein PilF